LARHECGLRVFAAGAPRGFPPPPQLSFFPDQNQIRNTDQPTGKTFSAELSRTIPKGSIILRSKSR
jgi:hypothetical protein